jgi:hypothetical protein
MENKYGTTSKEQHITRTFICNMMKTKLWCFKCFHTQSIPSVDSKSNMRIMNHCHLFYKVQSIGNNINISFLYNITTIFK